MSASGRRSEDPERRYEVVVRRDVRIPTGSLGVTLSADLFLPDGGEPAPVLITVLPYRRDLAALYGTPMQEWFASRGYASLLLDLRGTGSSDGTARPPLHQDDADDALAAIDWAIRQPWCDGTAGMWGDSYGAVMALRTAARRPAGLKAIVAVQGMTDPERDFAHPGGSRGALMPLGFWARNTLLSQLLPPVDFADPAEQARWRARLAASPYVMDLFRHGPGDPVWKERRFDAADVEVPALCVAGWRDLFAEGTVRAFERVSGPRRLVAGPWMHGSPQYSTVAPIDFLELALGWWDRWLRGIPGEAAPEVSVYVQGNRPRWLGLDAWPPEPTTFDLAGWRRSEPEVIDPAVGALSGLWAAPDGPFGWPMDQHDDDSRSLCHTSPPLEEPLLISGRPHVVLTDAWPRVSVKLADVDPAGRSTLICAGLGGEAVPLAPTTYEVAAGHRLRVVLAPGDFPRVWPRSPGDQRPVATELSLPVLDGAAEISHLSPSMPEISPVGRYEIASDRLNDTIAIRLANTAAVGGLRVEQATEATAYRKDPDASAITSEVHATVDTATGSRVTVDIGLTATSTDVTATGRVTLDGDVLLDRLWQGHPS